jgi:hypothetical protein
MTMIQLHDQSLQPIKELDGIFQLHIRELQQRPDSDLVHLYWDSFYNFDVFAEEQFLSKGVQGDSLDLYLLVQEIEYPELPLLEFDPKLKIQPIVEPYFKETWYSFEAQPTEINYNIAVPEPNDFGLVMGLVLLALLFPIKWLKKYF